MYHFFSGASRISAEAEQDLRAAFERGLDMLKCTDDRVVRVDTIQNKQRTSGVVLIVGTPETNDILALIDAWMTRQEKKRAAK